MLAVAGIIAVVLQVNNQTIWHPNLKMDMFV
jgi:hypothetical protein